MSPSILTIQNLHVNFKTSGGVVHGVNGVNLEVQAGETLGIVGESGCGKSVTALAILGLLPGNAQVFEGQITFQGSDLLRFSEQQLSKIRSSQISIVFQDPTSSLDPLFRIEDQISEVFRYHDFNGGRNLSKGRMLHDEIIRLLSMVRIPDAERVARSYPHQLSGGMKQRVMIAIALALNPAILILDEPTTALDVTTQDEILSLLMEMKNKLHTTIILITHDFGIVAETCDRVAVMYAGLVVETARTDDLLVAAKHPYTVGLLKSVPSPASEIDTLEIIPGTVPSLTIARKGCVFYDRCAMAMQKCIQQEPNMISVNPGHEVKCHLCQESK